MNNNEYISEIEKIENDWNSTFLEKGNRLYELGKLLEFNSKQQKDCFERAVHYYSSSKSEACYCNLAHCYFLLARIYEINPEEYFRRSIEYHIKGSKSKIYQHEEFYKFYTVDDNNIDSILQKIRLTKPSSFNDPTDCPIAQEGLPGDIFPNKAVFDGLRVCSFGHVKGKEWAWEDSKKWAYYGDSGKGICIRYRFFDNTIQKSLSDNFVFKKVEYKESFDFNRGIVADGFLSKTKCYEEENEWRIVWYDRNYKETNLCVDENGNVYLPIGRELIYQFFVGYRCSKSIIQKVLDFAQAEIHKIPVMWIHPSSEDVFKLTGTQIS